MITRKENLLTQPFQYKKYVQHRMKVNSALPRIDDISPANRNHVYLKCKKLQLEAERQSRIERDNFILLKHLSDIMTAKRIDNSWLCELPKFQHRVKLFHNRSSKVHPSEDNTHESADPKKLPKRIKENCVACNPSKFVTPVKIPEERVPWEMKIKREFSWSKKENEKRNIPEESKEKAAIRIPDIRRRHPSGRRQKRIPSAGCEYQSSSRRSTIRERPLTVVMKFPIMRN